MGGCTSYMFGQTNVTCTSKFESHHKIVRFTTENEHTSTLAKVMKFPSTLTNLVNLQTKVKPDKRTLKTTSCCWLLTVSMQNCQSVHDCMAFIRVPFISVLIRCSQTLLQMLFKNRLWLIETCQNIVVWQETWSLRFNNINMKTGYKMQCLVLCTC